MTLTSIMGLKLSDYFFLELLGYLDCFDYLCTKIKISY